MKLNIFLLCCILHLVIYDVQRCEGCIFWVPMTNGAISSDAVQGGWDNETLYVGRMHVQVGAKHSLIPGALYPSRGHVNAAQYEQAHTNVEYEVLGNCIAEWEYASYVTYLSKQLPALSAGYSAAGEILHVCHSTEESNTLIGWASTPTSDSPECHIAKDGQEYKTPKFHYLFCKNM